MPFEIYNEIRVGWWLKDLGDLASRYAQDFIPAPQIMPVRADMKKLGLMRKEGNVFYVVMMSSVDMPGSNEYNFMVSVTGNNEKRVAEVMGELEKKLNITLKPAPEHLTKTFGEIAKIFKIE